ncbi:MAG: CinA family nicotinamide mononucleotide deamidase-related protein [Planctomycetales bacterium]|nr:CinA family nicotinamide mononucleotide deamidase-related protein [Planctomycetales bacterium]
MLAEVIAIGDELTSGQRLDTNSQWISQQLGEVGVRVLYHSTCGDDLDGCAQVFQTALQRADLVIATGGLGPTADDLTRQAISQAAGLDLVLDEDSLEHIRSMFASRGRTMPEQNSIQAMFPTGSTIIPNPHGTAPGIDLLFRQTGHEASRLFALPGVPAEMKQMWTETVSPRIKNMKGTSDQIIRHYQLKCFGLGESDLESRLPDLIRRGRSPSVGITVHQGTITLRITATGSDEAECRQQMQPTIDTIHDCLGDIVFGDEDDELEHSVDNLLQAGQQTLAVYEAGTGGMITHWFGEMHPATPHFLGGIVGLDRTSAERILDLALPATLSSEDATRALAQAVRNKYQADIGLAVSPFPRPGQDNGHFYVATAGDVETRCQSFLFAGHPDILKPLAAKRALNFLRLHLKK